MTTPDQIAAEVLRGLGLTTRFVAGENPPWHVGICGIAEGVGCSPFQAAHRLFLALRVLQSRFHDQAPP